jgi:glutaredoxin-related protein
MLTFMKNLKINLKVKYCEVNKESNLNKKRHLRTRHINFDTIKRSKYAKIAVHYCIIYAVEYGDIHCKVSH